MTVYNETKLVIDTQSNEEILKILAYIFTMYARHPPDFQKDIPVSAQLKLKEMYTNELLRLNELTIRYLLPKTVSELQGQLDYLRDISQPMQIMELPVNHSVSGTREYKPDPRFA